MPNSYFPENDRELKDWLVNFTTVLAVNAPLVGMVAADVDPLTDDSDAFTAALSAYIQEQTVMASKMGSKKQTRAKAIATLRPLVRRATNHPGMTDQLRGMLGLPARTTTQTAAVTLSEDMPKMLIETEPGKVTVHFGTDPANERLNTRPEGVHGCNIYRAKSGSEDYQLIAFQKTSPYVDTIEGAAADYTYVVQYRGNRASQLGKLCAPQTVAARGGFVAQAA